MAYSPLPAPKCSTDCSSRRLFHWCNWWFRYYYYYYYYYYLAFCLTLMYSETGTVQSLLLLFCGLKVILVISCWVYQRLSFCRAFFFLLFLHLLVFSPQKPVSPQQLDFNLRLNRKFFICCIYCNILSVLAHFLIKQIFSFNLAGTWLGQD